LKFFKAFGQFWYDFIIGDDWKIAVAVTAAVGASIALMSTQALSDLVLAVVGGVLILAAFSISLILDVRAHPH
jgi:hypothetical protein